MNAASVQFRVRVYSPGVESCLFFDETYTKNMSTSDGAFAIVIGGDTASSVNTEPFTLSRLFQNRGTFTFTGGKCASGTTYTPSLNDGRKLQLSFDDGSGFEDVPPQAIGQVPQAIESESVSGFKASELFRVVDGSGNPVGLSAWSQTDYTKLTDVIAGTSALYRGAAAPVAGADVAGNISGNSVGFSGSLAGDVTGTQGAATVVKIQGRAVDSTAPSNGQVLKWNSGTSKWEPAAEAGGGGGTIASITATSPVVKTGTATDPILSVTVGTTSGTLAAGDDSRFANARAPTGAAGGDLGGTYPNPTISTVPATKGGTGLTALGISNQVLGINNAGTAMEYKTMTAGSGITITPSAGVLTIAATGSGGEDNTASNVGAGGVGLWKSKTGVNLDFKNINAASSAITVTNDVPNSEVDIGVNAELGGLAGISSNGFLKRTGAGTYSSSSSLALASDVSGTLPVANGGTGLSSIGNLMVMGTNGSGVITPVGGSLTGSVLQYSPTGAVYSTAAFPTSTTANQLLYSSADNVVGGLSSANNSILTTNGSGVPAWSTPSSGDLFTQYTLLAGRSGGQTINGGTAVSNNLTLDSNSTGTKGNVLINPSSGNVGIGTTLPAVGLHVEAAGAVPMRVRNTGATAGHFWQVGPDTTGSFLVYNQSGTGAWIGDGQTAWNASSDIRLKKQIHPIDNALARILQIEGKTYLYKTDEDSAPRRVGVIAQDVQKVLPEAVSERNGFLGVKYSELIPLAINAIRELYNNWSVDHEKIASLESENLVLRRNQQQMKSWACAKDPDAAFCR